MNQTKDLEKETWRIGQEILGGLKAEKYSLFQREWWGGQVLKWAMQDEDFKVALFRFIDVLPSLNESSQVVRLLKEYFDLPGKKFPPLVSWGLKTLTPTSPAGLLAARTIRAHVTRMAQQFIVGADVEEALPKLQEQWKKGLAFSLALLGEVAVNEEESRAYVVRYIDLLDRLAKKTKSWTAQSLLENDPSGVIPRVNLSVKITSLYSQIDPMDWDGSVQAVCERLRPIVQRARNLGAHVHLDMEHYLFKDLILAIFFKLLSEEGSFSDLHHAGLAIQAYLKDSEQDLLRVIQWAQDHEKRITVRLVKGAYWDYETVVHRQKGWPVPVYLDKGSTDYNYERLTDLLLDHAHHVRPAFGGHNVRSIAHVIAAARLRGLTPADFELQVLYGMGGPLQSVLSKMGYRVRVYTPIGELIPGMAYLVRRLLENTSNESFVRKSFLEGQPLEAILARPVPKPPIEPASKASVRGEGDRPAGWQARDPRIELPDRFENEPHADFSRIENRQQMQKALEKVRKELGRFYPLVVGGKEVRTSQEVASLNPARPEEVVGRVAMASAKEADQAIEKAREVFVKWQHTTAQERAKILFKAANEMRKKRFELAAWEVYEAGKTWREADADVTESIDFLRYYAQEMIRISTPQSMGHYPGEKNLYLYRPRGIGLVISPWNFPLAIPAGMVSAAIVTGNCVIFKPSNFSPVMGFHLAKILEGTGLPRGVLNFLPGDGESVGEYLVRHPEIAFIAFTGSKAVGLKIVELAGKTLPGQRQIKRVVAEMGGKNAIIVDDTADLDIAVQGVVASAMGYQGQKCSACSRVIVLEAVYEELVQRVVNAVKSLKVGPPENPGNFIGPVIDLKAKERIYSYIEKGKKQGRVVLIMDTPAEGFYVGPTIITELEPEDSLAQEEIFGPVLVVLRAKDFNEALEIANGVDYALTGGVYSRSPANIQRAMEAFEVGNLYINRGITGALVGRQPFGGFRMSGIGSKAGGPDYLTQFMVPVAISENTLRRGFAPSQDH
jgi:RHH-type proline utilization regulon transcriptional repressor/proline dehydrogenase/delta 1-pyrroline-5-carboxylate dehydrogenase